MDIVTTSPASQSVIMGHFTAMSPTATSISTHMDGFTIEDQNKNEKKNIEMLPKNQKKSWLYSDTFLHDLTVKVKRLIQPSYIDL